MNGGIYSREGYTVSAIFLPS